MKAKDGGLSSVLPFLNHQPAALYIYSLPSLLLPLPPHPSLHHRCVCLLAETLLFVEYACPSTWTCALVRTVPDLFFLTTYSLLILFWAQLSHTATGAPFPWLRPAFLVSNGLLYLGFSLIVILGGSRVLGSGQVLQALFILLGVSYILSTLFLFKYALRFSKMALPYVLRRRLIALCVLCGVGFVVHVAYYLGVATGLLSTWVAAGYPPQINAYVFDALLYPLWELLPSLAILAVLHKRKPGSGMAPHHLSSAYPYLDSVPYSKIGNGQLGNGGGGGGSGAGGGNGGASHSAALASAFYKLNGSSAGGGGGGGRGFGAGGKGGRQQQQQHPWMNVVVKEGRDAQGGGGVLGLMGIYTPIEATTTPSTSSESTASAYQGVS